MLECIGQALNKVSSGVIIYDTFQNIVFWNAEMEKLSGISEKDVMNRRLSAICAKFSENRYAQLFDSVINTGQGRFCSSVLHKSFFIPENESEKHQVRQNMRVEPLWVDGNVKYAVIEINDITEQIKNEYKLKEVIGQLNQGYEKVKESEEAVKQMVRYDQLTGVLTRKAFLDEVDHTIERLDHENDKFALLFIDLDGFKHVNDTYGHIIGDVLLQHVAGRFKNITRQEKARQCDIIGRIGGDEFVIAIFGLKSIQNVSVVADKIVQAIRKPFTIDEKSISISVSIGIAIYPDDNTSVQTLIGLADQAMYKIKHKGKNAFSFYTMSSAPQRPRR